MVALTFLTATIAGSVVVADRALSGVDGEPRQRHAAVAVADRLVAAGSPLTRRRGVVTEAAAGNLSAAAVDRAAPAARGRPLRVRLRNRTLVDRGTARGPTVRRLVRVASGARERRLALSGNRSLTVGPTPRVELSFPASSAVRTVRTDGRVRLHAPTGLSGTAVIETSPVERTTVRVNATAANGTVLVRTFPPADTITLSVTVGARRAGGNATRLASRPGTGPKTGGDGR